MDSQTGERYAVKRTPSGNTSAWVDEEEEEEEVVDSQTGERYAVKRTPSGNTSAWVDEEEGKTNERQETGDDMWDLGVNYFLDSTTPHEKLIN